MPLLFDLTLESPPFCLNTRAVTLPGIPYLTVWLIIVKLLLVVVGVGVQQLLIESGLEN